MKVRGIFKILFGSIIGFNLLILILLLTLKNNQERQYREQVNRFNSFNFSIQLRESSEDLTEYCRNFVVTGDPFWEKKYWEIVDRRMGRLNNEAYRKSVVDSMRSMGFVKREFDLLSTALERSNSLILIEKEAMNAANGQFLDGQGDFTIKGDPDFEYAKELLFNDIYLQYKKSIMDPINEFERVLESRTKIETDNYAKSGSRLLIAIIILMAIIALFSIYAFIMIRKRIIKEEETARELERSQLQFQTLVNNIPGVIYNCGLDDPWEMYFITDEISNLSGYSKEDFMGANPKRSFGEIMHPDDREEASEIVQKAITSKQPFVLGYRVIDKNGKVHSVFGYGQAIYRSDGTPDYLVGGIFDDTERQTAIDKVKESEERFQYALDVANEGIWEWNEETDALSYSVRCFSMIGYLPVEGEKNLFDFWNKVIHKDDADKALMNEIENVKKRGLYDVIYRAISNSNEIKWIHVRGKAVKFSADGKPSRIIGTMSDITDRMRQEEKIVSAILETEDSERSRIARDIHDGLQQTMSTSLMSLEKVRSSIDFEDPNIYDKFHMGYKFLKKAIEESRTLAHNLMPKVVDQAGIVAAIESLLTAMKDSSETKFVFEQNLNDERLKLSEEMTFYRIVQEAINNVIKYSNAKNCTIQLLKYKDSVNLAIDDDGVGFDVDMTKDTFGINSMKTRADSIGAYFEINSRIQKGTNILLELKLN